MGSVHRVALVILALVAISGVGAGFWYESQRRSAERYLVFVVPLGSVARLAAGEELEILPQTIELSLQGKDTLVIRNEDVQPIQVGPFKIDPGQQFEQRYYNPGTYDLICTLHTSQRLRIVVSRE
ncbi:hypothetical protein [Roseiflexus sp.]|uniref:cupredoxin domain-containing protein n=1 Tax=Roseiflexus sp. TaxID=2562120 RepID=UPI00398AC455